MSTLLEAFHELNTLDKEPVAKRRVSSRQVNEGLFSNVLTTGNPAAAAQKIIFNTNEEVQNENLLGKVIDGAANGIKTMFGCNEEAEDVDEALVDVGGINIGNGMKFGNGNKADVRAANGLKANGNKVAIGGAKVSGKEDVCPECGKKVCECDKQPVEECDLQEEIEDEVNNGEIYSPDDVTDEEIDDMLDWMLHNGHYGKYTYNLDTVEGYQRLVSDAALNMISDEGIEPKSALARDLRSTSEFKEWEQAVVARLKAVYGVDPSDFDADLV